MRIGLISMAFVPEATGIGPYSGDLAVGLCERGHEVRVVTTFPFYPQWKARVPGPWTWSSQERLGPVEVTRVRCYVPRSPTAIRRALHDLSFALTSIPSALRLIRWSEATVVVSPSLGSAMQGALARVLGAGHLHLHVQDLVTDLAGEVGLARGKPFRLLLSLLGTNTYRSYRSVSVLSPAMKTRLDSLGVPAARIAVLPNWIRVQPRQMLGMCAPEARRTGPYAVFSGSFGRKQGLAALADIARKLQPQGVRVVVLGDGAGRGAVLDQGAGGLEWAGLVDEPAFDRYLRNAAVGIVSLAPGVGVSIVPSKLVTYMAYGLPAVVMADANTPVADIVRAAGCGIVVDAGDAVGGASAIARLVADPMEARALGEAGAAYAAAHWSRDHILGRFEGVLRQVAAQRDA